MNKKKMTILTLLLLITFILSISMASAADTDNNQTTDTITEEATIENTEPVQNDIPETYTKEITKSNKQDVKEAGTRVDVNNYDELASQVNKIQQGTQKEYTINLKPGNYNATTEMTLEQKNGINYKLTINGNNITLDGQKEYAFIYVNKCSLELKNITLKNFKSEDDATITIKNGTLKISNSNISNNSRTSKDYSYYGGGAISTYNSTCTITQSTLNNNNATTNGGAIFTYYYSNCTITQSTLQNNTAKHDGGAIYTDYYSNCTITQSTLNNNNAHNGGAIYTDSLSNCTITQSTLNNNNANNDGGAINIKDTSNCTITQSTLNNNKANFRGGAILNYGTLNIKHTSLNNNNATTNGGAIYTYKHKKCTITQSTLTNNTAEYEGGAIYITYYIKCTITNTNLTNNTAKYGGAIYIEDNSNCTLTQSTLNNNTATYGGAIYTSGSNCTITNTNLTNNTAKYGGAIYNATSCLIIQNSIFKNNKADEENNIYNQIGKTTIYLNKISEKNYRDLITIQGQIRVNDNRSMDQKLNISILINDEKINLTTAYNGKFSTKIQLNSTGKYIIKAIFNGKDQYLPSNATISFNVTKRNTTIKTKVEDAFLNKPVTITGNLTDKSNTKLRNANIYITINKEKYHILTDANGTYTLNYTPTIKGTNNITIQYKGNKNYEATNITTTFEVDKDLIIKSSYYRDNITIKALITENNKPQKNKDVKLTINNETTTLKTDENGIKAYTTKSTTAGTNTLKITYNNKTTTQTFTTQKRNTTITATSPKTTTINKQISIKGNLTDQSNTKLRNANIYITINKEKYHILTDANGTYTLNYTPTTTGTYNITITYKGNKNYQSTNTTRTLKVS